jgi:CheY-like chemotaxis protein
VSEAGDGVEGLDRLDAEGRAVDLVLTDLVTPRMTGEEFGRRVRVRAPHLPILCMSGTPGTSAVDADPWSALQLLPKPISLPFLSSRIASALTAGVTTAV